MNNTDFRRFVLDTPRQARHGSSQASVKSGQTPGAFGSRSKSSIPMTPRTIKGTLGVDFARQLAEQNAPQQQKKFRSSAAPKGSKLPEGYHDRARDREGYDEGSVPTSHDKEARIQALEEQMKLGQIDKLTFEKLRDQITGGDVGATHLVKGLDRQLLERVRRGENVLGGQWQQSEDRERQNQNTAEPSADDELETLEKQEVAPVQRAAKTVKKSSIAPPSPVARVKRSRNEILADMKAAREAAKMQESQLGSRFRKVGTETKASSRIERDNQGREVLIIVDEDGRVKRKVRKVELDTDKKQNGLLMPDKDAIPLGMKVPDHVHAAEAQQDSDEDDGDIFDGVGDEYDPLKDEVGANESDDSSSEDEVLYRRTVVDTNAAPKPDPPAGELAPPRPKQSTPLPPGQRKADEAKAAMPPPPPPPTAKRNYFSETSSSTDASEGTKSTPFSDPTILATLKRAAALNAVSSPEDAEESRESGVVTKPSSAAQRLLQRDRDYDDIDFGFGSSRAGDEEDAEEGGKKVKMSEWKGIGAEDDADEGGGRERGGKQRKRGKKKRKGDKDSASDVLRVIEGRKGGGA